jgi:hypothetical protein
MTERGPSKPTVAIARREHRAEIVDRLYEVALDPIRLEDLLEVWEGHTAPLRAGPVDQAMTLDDPEIEAHLRARRSFWTVSRRRARMAAIARCWKTSPARPRSCRMAAR